jgi:N-acylneuraminate cytidylyltransferase
MVQCTSPFVTPAEVNGVVALVESGADSAFTAAATHAFLWRTGDNGAAVGVNHDSRTRLRRQERGQEFEESGAVYAMRTVGFRAARHRFFGRVAIHEVPKAHALEIDDPDDLVMAQVIASGFSDHQRHAALPNPVLAVVFDFDGVLTDNRVLTFADGGEAVSSDRSDGLGLEQLRQEGLPMVVLSKERHPVVAARCAKLGIAVQQGLDDKESVLRAWIDDQGLDPAGVVFVGNDVNDLGCLQAVGCGVVVADAHESVLGAADIVLSRPGGRGSVRELADLILAAKRSMLT